MEKHLEQKVNKLCKSLGLRVTKFVDQSRRGAPDRIVWYPRGRLLFIEAKFGRNGLSDHQIEYHDILRAEGHEVISSNNFSWLESEILRFYEENQA